MDFVALAQEKLRKIGTVLAGDAGDQRLFSHREGSLYKIGYSDKREGLEFRVYAVRTT